MNFCNSLLRWQTVILCIFWRWDGYENTFWGLVTFNDWLSFTLHSISFLLSYLYWYQYWNQFTIIILTEKFTKILAWMFCFCVSTYYRPIENERENVYSKFLLMKSSKKVLSFYLRVTWLYGSWYHPKILKKKAFWKYESWFSSEVPKITSVNYL